MNGRTAAQLSEDLAAIAKDAEEIFGGDGEQVAARAKEIRDRLAEALAATDQTIERLAGPGKPAGAIDQAIRDNPYKAVGLAVGVGLILGLLLRRK